MARRKPQWSQEAREAARQRAYDLIAAGTFGGAPGRGGRPKAHPPEPRDLLRILRASHERKNHPETAEQHEWLATVEALAVIASALDIDRDFLLHLLTGGVEMLVSDGILPQLVVLRDDGETELHWARNHELLKGLRRELEALHFDDARLVVPRDLVLKHARECSDAQLIEALGLVACLTSRELLSAASRTR